MNNFLAVRLAPALRPRVVLGATQAPVLQVMVMVGHNQDDRLVIALLLYALLC